jgi:hypothetical protein
MKKTILTLSIFLIGMTVSTVQARNTIHLFQTAAQENSSNKRLQTIKDVCKTTPEQSAKVQSLLNDYETTQAANEKTYKGNADGLKEAQKKNSYNFNQQLAKVLTPEQIKALNASDQAYAKSKKTK